MKRIFYLILISLFFLFPSLTNASEEYSIDEYNLEINVNKNNDYEYKEKLLVTFHMYDIDIVKILPYNTENISIDNEYKVETTDKKTVTIPSNRLLNSTYNISYTIKNNTNNYNTYKFNLNGNYNNTISKFTFTITLPTDITKNNVKFYLHNEDITNKIEYKINGNKITGTYEDGLLRNETIIAEITYNKAFINMGSILLIIIPPILTLISYLLWYYYGKDLKLNIVKSSTLPQELTPLDLYLAKNEIVTPDDLFTLLLNLGNKGYIRIKEEKNNEFTIERLKDYDGDNELEDLFLKSLFRKKVKVSLSEYIDIISTKKNKINDNTLEDKVTNEDLPYKYKLATNNVLPLINNDEKKSQYYELNSESKKNYLIAFIAVIILLITSVPFIETNRLYLLFISTIYSIVILKVIINIVDQINLENIKKNKNNKKNIIIIIILLLLSFIMLMTAFKRNLLYTIAFIIGFICSLIILILYKYMPKRTIYGNKIYSKIESLKLFINTCSNDEIQEQLKNNKNYLYNLLPYSYLMNCEERVIKLLKEFNTSLPKWYILKDDKTITKLNNSILRLRRKLKNINEELQ